MSTIKALLLMCIISCLLFDGRHCVVNNNTTTTVKTTEADDHTDVSYDYACNDSYVNCTVSSEGASDPFGSSTTTLLPPLEREKKTGESKFRLSSGETCSCNLIVDSCDLNCCCDVDCDDLQKEVFSRCDDVVDRFAVDSRFCNYVDYVYENNTLYEWQVNRNSLFCIVKYNLPKRVRKEEKYRIIGSQGMAMKMKRDAYTWPSAGPQSHGFVAANGTLKLGDRLWTYNNSTRTVANFAIPNDLTTETCLTDRHVRFLKSTRSVCHSTHLDDEDARLSAETYYKNLTIVALPSLLNLTLSTMSNWKCPRNVCIEIEPSFCDEQLSNCTNVTRASRPKCRVSIYADEVHCIDLLQRASYVIHHNGTRGIERVALRMILTNHTYKLSDASANFPQRFDVEYVWSRRPKIVVASHRRSGRPGYLTHKPIPIAELLTANINETNRTNGTLEIVKNVTRNEDDFTRSFLTLPKSIDGTCAFDASAYTVVEFGVDSTHKCRYRSPIASNQTGNATCRHLQRVIFDYWRISLTTNDSTVERSLIYGRFGDADSTKSNDWDRALFYKLPNDLLADIDGRRENNRLVCYNVSTVLRIDVFHTRTIRKNLIDQEMISGIVYDFVGAKRLDFVVDDATTGLDVDLKHEVAFYDAKMDAIDERTIPSMMIIKLPADFFYPFVRLNNAARRCRWSVAIEFVSILVCSRF